MQKTSIGTLEFNTSATLVRILSELNLIEIGFLEIENVSLEATLTAPYRVEIVLLLDIVTIAKE